MMIRINLLPVRQVRKREMGRQTLVLIAFVLVLAGLANYLWLDSRDAERKRGEDQIAETSRKIKELEKVIGEVNDINKRKNELQDKLKVLGDLRKGRAGPVRFLDALATATPKKVWVLSFAEAGNAVSLSGNALSHEDVADFMRSLSSMVWTPKGMGRLVEQKRDAINSRVELLGQGGQIEEFPVAQVGAFFNDIELRSAVQAKATGPNTGPTVKFEISFRANYTI